MVTRDNPYDWTRGEVMRNIQLNYEKMREVVLAHNYAKVLIVEQDMIVPEDTLSKMMEVEAPIVTGLYALRHGVPVPNIFKHDNKKHLGTNMNWQEVKKDWGKTVRVSGGAMGCLLLDRSVVESFSFMIEESRAPDMKFMVHCAEKQIETQARLDVVCGHIRPNGEVLWPDQQTGYRIERMN